MMDSSLDPKNRTVAGTAPGVLVGESQNSYLHLRRRGLVILSQRVSLYK